MAFGPPDLLEKPQKHQGDYISLEISKKQMNRLSVGDKTYDEADELPENNCVVTINSIKLGKKAFGNLFCNYIDADKSDKENEGMKVFGDSAKIESYDWQCTHWD